MTPYPLVARVRPALRSPRRNGPVLPSLRSGIALFLAAFAAQLASPAKAADTIIRFDDRVAGAAIDVGYHEQGIDFDSGANPILPSIAAGCTNCPANGSARSNPNVLIIGNNGANEFRSNFLRGKFTNPHHTFVEIWTGSSATVPIDMTLEVFDRVGNRLGLDAKRIDGGKGINTRLFASSPNPQIASFILSANNVGPFVVIVDDLRFDTRLEPEGPDFDVKTQNSGAIELEPGGPSREAIVDVIRYSNSAGDITLTANNLPTGVVVDSIAPNPMNAGGAVTITLRALPGARGALNWPIRITGTGTPTAGAYGPHNTEIAVSVPDTYDAQIVGIEVTQGIQKLDLPQKPNPSSIDPVSYSQPGREGVSLAQGARTVVRVFASYRKTPDLNRPPAIDCMLYGNRMDNDAALPGSPIPHESAGGRSSTPKVGPDTVTDNLRQGKEGLVFTFTLPPSWARGKIKLTATLVAAKPPEWSFGGLTTSSRDTVTANDSFTLTDVVFQATHNIRIAPIAMKVPTEVYVESLKAFRHDPHLEIPDPEDVLGRGRSLLPVAEDFGLEVSPYIGEIWITDIWNGDEDATKKGALVQARLKEQVYDFVSPGTDKLVVGVFPGDDSTGVVRANALNGTAIVQARDRPFSSVMHEVGHLLSLDHASGACSADKEDSPFDMWPPDGKGYIQGVGYDTRSGRLLFPGKDGKAPEFFDIMSYCGNNSGGDVDKWISVRNWQKLFDSRKRGEPGQELMAGPGPRPLQATPSLVVRAVAFSDGTALLSSVTKASGTPVENDPASPYRLVAKDAAGSPLIDAGMRQETLHIHGGDEGQFLIAEIPAADVASVEVTRAAAVLASRRRSATVPTLEIESVQPDIIRAGEIISGVKWNAADADGDSLLTRIDFSPDGGATWRPIYAGPNTNEAALKANYFPATGNGLLRIRVNDGFNETETVSQTFAAKGSLPTARILSPVAGATVKMGTSLNLSGQAYTDNGDPLPSTALFWTLNGTYVGEGSPLTVPGLIPGRNRIQLFATDARANTTIETVEIDAVP